MPEWLAAVMRYPKPPLSFEEQLLLLEERGLAIGDRNAAAHALARISYYRLSAYWHPFKNADDSFEPGASFDSALTLYEFDRHLRLQVMDAIERVEIALRTSITYTLAHAYGAFAHCNAANFRSRFHHRTWVSKIEDEARRSKEVFIEHYKEKYEGFPALPIWMATEVIPLGTLSRLYEGMFAKDQRCVAADYDIHHEVLRSWLRTLCYIRNLCAHHSRLWNREIPVAPSLPRHDPLWIPPVTPTNRRLFAVLLVLRQLMAHHHQGRHWQQRVTGLVEPITEWDRWRNAMGLPTDWQTHPLWNPNAEA
jgi:abortive infection bacteriophage resistance protein